MYKRQEEDILAFAERNKHKITCINVSRHMQHYVVESNDSLLTRLPVPFRINCVLYKDYPKENLIPFIERFRKLPGANIQFRFDYTATTPENLYEPDKILHDLKEIAEYTGLDGCRMRCGFHFDYKGMELTYHKTLPYSCLLYTSTDIPISFASYTPIGYLSSKKNNADRQTRPRRFLFRFPALLQAQVTL